VTADPPLFCIHIGTLQQSNLRRPQPVPIRQQKNRLVPFRVNRLEQLPELVLREKVDDAFCSSSGRLDRFDDFLDLAIFNTIALMATIMKLRQCQPHDWQITTFWPAGRPGGWAGGTPGVIGDNYLLHDVGGQAGRGRRRTLAWPPPRARRACVRTRCPMGLSPGASAQCAVADPEAGSCCLVSLRRLHARHRRADHLPDGQGPPINQVSITRPCSPCRMPPFL